MLLLVSGEGPGDIGVSSLSQSECDTAGFNAGPLTLMIDQFLQEQPKLQYSLLAAQSVYFVAKHYLADDIKPSSPKLMKITGKKTSKETGYFYRNARAFARYAQTLSARLQRPVIAVLFRDADGTASAGRGNWQDKHQSMLAGFAEEGSAEVAVPMLAAPKSEAWFICACKQHPYQHCNALETRSGNDNSPHSLKAELASLVTDNSTVGINNLVESGVIDIHRIDMPSLNEFKRRLSNAVAYIPVEI
jgi:hypothetical protein